MEFSIPSGLPFLGSNVEGASSDSPDFPLPVNATSQDLVTFVDGLALKIYAKGYWPIELALNVVNMSAFLFVAVALRAYRSRESPAPFWLFKFERRQYRVKRSSIVPTATTAASDGVAADVQRLPWPIRWSQRIFGRRQAMNSNAAEEDADSDCSPSRSGTGGEEVRMGWFFTASCINCHLVMTGTYIIILSIETIQSWMIREGTAGPPLLDPCLLEALMICALFSTAYFAAIGYIALLLPNAPPWLWNGTVIGIYLQVIITGIVSMTELAISSSKITVYRTYIHLAYVSMPSLADVLSKNSVLGQAGVKLMLFEIAKVAHKESLRYRRWKQIAQGLVAYGGFGLAMVYLMILITLCRRVAKELVQLRNSASSSPSGDSHAASRGLAAAPAWSAMNDKISVPLLQAAQNGLPLRHFARAPPTSPAPSGPLPLPPVEASRTDSKASGPEVARDTRHNSNTQNLTEPNRRFSHPFSLNANVAGAFKPGGRRERFSTLSGVAHQQHYDVSPESHLAHFPTQDSDTRPVSPASSIDEAGLDLGPRLRRGSDADPWGFDTLHEDMATNDGYSAICRFLFNCIIDHVAIMLQCFAFGLHSGYLLVVFTKSYPNDAGAASKMSSVAAMAASCLFTVLYVVNCLNLFAPFLLFPASQVKLASMLASLSLTRSIRDDGGLRFRKRKMQTSSVPESQRSMEEQTEGWGLKHQYSHASLVASEGKMTSERYTSSLHGKSGSIGSGIMMEGLEGSLSDHPFRRSFRRELGAVIVSEDPFTAFASNDNSSEYPPKSTPTSPSPSQKRSLGMTSPTGHGASARGKITASVVNLFRKPGCAESHEGILPNTVHGSEQNGETATSAAPLQSAKSSLGSAFGKFSMPPASGVNKSSPWPLPPLRSRFHSRKEGEQGSGGQSLGSKSSNAASLKASQQQKASKGAQLVLDSLISSHALPIQGFYCQTGALDSSSALQLYQRPHGDPELGMAAAMFEGFAPAPRRTKPRRHQEHARSSVSSPSPPQPQQKPLERQQKHESLEATEQLKSPIVADFNASMGEGSNRRRQKLRQQFRSQVEQRRVSQLLSSSTSTTSGTPPHDPDSPTDIVPKIVAHPPTPSPASSRPSSAATQHKAPWLDRSGPSQDGRHDTVISLPIGFQTSGSEDEELDDEDEEVEEVEDDRRSIVSGTFGGV